MPHPPLELADVGHPRVDLGGAGLERHPALACEHARGGAHAAEPPAAGLADEDQRLAGADRRRQRHDLPLERVVGQRPLAELDHLLRAPRAADRAQRVERVPVGLHAAQLREHADRDRVAEQAGQGDRVVELRVGDGADVDPLARGGARSPPGRAARRGATLAGPADCSTAVTSPSPMCVSSARSRNTTRCPRCDRDLRAQPRDQVEVTGLARERLERRSRPRSRPSRSPAPAAPRRRGRRPARPRAGNARSRAARRRGGRFGQRPQVSSASSSSRHCSPASSS